MSTIIYNSKKDKNGVTIERQVKFQEIKTIVVESNDEYVINGEFWRDCSHWAHGRQFLTLENGDGFHMFLRRIPNLQRGVEYVFDRGTLVGPEEAVKQAKRRFWAHITFEDEVLVTASEVCEHPDGIKVSFQASSEDEAWEKANEYLYC